MRHFVVPMFVAAFTLYFTSAHAQQEAQPPLRNPVVIQKSFESPTPGMNSYAWDEINHRGNLIWSCRSMQSGKYVPDDLCKEQPKVDSVWPDKNVPGHWKWQPAHSKCTTTECR